MYTETNFNNYGMVHLGLFGALIDNEYFVS